MTTQETFGRPPGTPLERPPRRPPGILLMRIKLKSLCKELSWEPCKSFPRVSREPSQAHPGTSRAGFLEAPQKASQESLVSRIKLKSPSNFELPGAFPEAPRESPRSLPRILPGGFLGGLPRDFRRGLLGCLLGSL